MAAQRGEVRRGLRARPTRSRAKKAEEIFDNIERFAGYGFNKSHSAAYAVIAYQTAYLKAHYPVEFMAALLSSEIGNTDKLPVLVAEAQEMGIEVLPPERQRQRRPLQAACGGRAIRFGLAGVKNVGVGAVEALIVERETQRPVQGPRGFLRARRPPAREQEGRSKA